MIQIKVSNPENKCNYAFLEQKEHVHVLAVSIPCNPTKNQEWMISALEEMAFYRNREYFVLPPYWGNRGFYEMFCTVFTPPQNVDVVC